MNLQEQISRMKSDAKSTITFFSAIHIPLSSFNHSGIKLGILPRIQNPTEDWIDTELFLSYSLEDFERLLKSPPIRKRLLYSIIVPRHIRDIHNLLN